MLNRADIDQLAQKLAEVASPGAKIVLFGSHARGEATEDSDIDILVLQEQIENRPEEYFRLMKTAQTMTSNIDLILMKQEDFEWKSMVGGTLPYWAKKEGLVLYDGQS